MARYLTLQNNTDTAIVAGDLLGQIQFASSADSDGGDAIKITASIASKAEGTFSASANPASIIFSTGPSSTPTERIKINNSGHLIPMTNHLYDLGSSSSGFRYLHISGIYFDGLGPQTLPFNDFNVAANTDTVTVTDGNTVTFTGQDSVTVSRNGQTIIISGSGGGGGTTYTAGSGLTLDGTEFNVFGGTGQFRQVLFEGDSIQIGTDSNASDGIAIGKQAGISATFVGDSAILIGEQAGYQATSIDGDLFIGRQAGYQSDNGTDNVGVGFRAFYTADNNFQCTAIGPFAGQSSSNGYRNTFLGGGAGLGGISTTGNVYAGYQAGYLCDQNYSVMLGYFAGRGSEAEHSILIGYYAGYTVNGTGNIEILTSGTTTSVIDGYNNKLHIEKIILGDTSSKLLAIGNVTSANLTPDATLEILPAASTDVGLIVQGAASQSANLQEWQDSTSVAQAHVDATGGISGTSYTFADGTIQTTAAAGGMTSWDLGVGTESVIDVTDGESVTFSGLNQITTTRTAQRIDIDVDLSNYYTISQVDTISGNLQSGINGKDNYQYWTLKGDAATTTNVDTTEQVEFNGAGATTVALGGTDNRVVTITSTNTTYTAGSGMVLNGTTFDANVNATKQTVAAEPVSSTASRTYSIQVDNTTDDLVVNVPWTDNNTTYSAGSGLVLNGTTFDAQVDNSTIEINSDTFRVKDGGITNAKLQNSSITITPGTGIGNAGEVSLGGSVTVNANSATTSQVGVVQLQDSATNGTVDKAITPNAVYDISGNLQTAIDAKDNYQYWTLKGDAVTTTNVDATEQVEFNGAGSVSVSIGGTDNRTVTISGTAGMTSWTIADGSGNTEAVGDADTLYISGAGSVVTDYNTTTNVMTISGAAGGGGGTPGGNNTEFQYNNGGSFEGTSGVVYGGVDGTGILLKVQGTGGESLFSVEYTGTTTQTSVSIYRNNATDTANLFQVRTEASGDLFTVSPSGKLYYQSSYSQIIDEGTASSLTFNLDEANIFTGTINSTTSTVSTINDEVGQRFITRLKNGVANAKVTTWFGNRVSWPGGSIPSGSLANGDANLFGFLVTSGTSPTFYYDGFLIATGLK